MTADEQYHANLAFLGHHPVHEATYQGLSNQVLTNLKLLPTPSGAMYGEVYDVATQQWVALCHPQDPWGQARHSCDQFYTPNARVFCMIGLGLGYNAVTFAQRLKPYQRLCIWDVDGMLFKAMMHCVDIRPLFEIPNVNILVGDEVANHVEHWWLQLHAPEKLMIQMPMQEGYTSVYLAPRYKALMDRTVEMLRFHGVGLSTWRLFGRAIGDNDLENIPEYFACPGYEQLAGAWAGQPAVCLAAGPSLQRNLAQILDPATRDRIAVISAGTVYAFVQGLGLAPDIVTTIDFQRLNWTDQFLHVPLDPECTLVYLHSTYPQTVRRWPGPRFVAENSSDTMTWLRRYAGPTGKHSAAEVQTVAHLSLKVALVLGADPIILLGQDLSMPRATHHAAGARAQDQAPNETAQDAFVEVPDFQGKPIHTRHSFLSMLTVFQRLVAEAAPRTIYNCSEAGLAIPGAIHCPLAEALAPLRAHPAPSVALRATLRQIHDRYVPHIEASFYPDTVRLRTDLEAITALAATMECHEMRRLAIDEQSLTGDIQAAMLAAEVESPSDVVEALRSTEDAAILECEAGILLERPQAWAMIAIRRFDFIELMAEIPPPPEAVATLAAQRRYNAARLLRVAEMIREEAPVVGQHLRQMQRRFVALHPGQVPADVTLTRVATRDVLWEIAQFFALQAYDQGIALLERAWKDIPLPVAWRLLAQYHLHRQEYAAALAFWRRSGIRHGAAQRLARWLARDRAATRLALPAYFRPRPPDPRMPADPGVNVDIFY